MPQERRSGPRPGSRSTTTNCGQGNAVAPTLPIARALLLPRAGRRSMDVAIVLSCCYCRSSHLHRGYVLDGALRESGCQPAREYVLAVTR